MSSQKEITYDDLLFAMQQRNLVYNYNFLMYSNKTVETAVTYGHPDGWVYHDPGNNGMIGFDPTSNSCLLKKSQGDDLMTFSQAISEFPRWKDTLTGKRVTACAELHIPGDFPAEITFSIDDGKGVNSKSLNFEAGETKTMEVNLKVDGSATHLKLSIESSTSEVVIYVRKVYANIGSVAIESLPCMVEGTIGERKQYVSTEIPPPVELSLCKDSVELSDNYTRLNSFLNGRFGTGTNGNSLLPDMRGYFSRAWDNGAAVDPDANNRTALGQGSVTGDHVGTVQQDRIKEHTHPLKFDTTGQIPAGPSAALPSINKLQESETDPFGGKETRGKNISELLTMKWA